MLAKFTSIRYRYIRSHLYALFLITLLLLAIFLTIYVVFDPKWLTVSAIFTFLSLYLVLGFFVSVYAGFKSSGNLKERIDYLSLQITQYANGNYGSRLYMNEEDEISIISKDLNTLGEKLQNQVKSLQRMADERAEYARSAHRTATVEERQRLARELHDSVSQQLFALTMLAEAAVNVIERDPDKAKTQLEEVAKAGLTAQTEMRALLLHLRPVYLSGDSLEEGIKQLIEELKQHSPLEVRVRISEQLSLAETVEEHVFRIVQESLSNILRHANAKSASIHIVEKADKLFIHISDDGEGFDEHELNRKKTSYGLNTMKERAEELGGTFQIKSRKNQGTYIDIRIPIEGGEGR